MGILFSHLLTLRHLRHAIHPCLGHRLGHLFVQWAKRQYFRLCGLVWPRTLHYRNASDESRYWRSSAHDRATLDRWNGHSDRGPQWPIPLVAYYTPRLLPTYREPRQRDLEEDEYPLSARTFCKWHCMVFPGRVSTRP